METRNYNNEICNLLAGHIRGIVDSSKEITDNKITFLVNKILHCNVSKLEAVPELHIILSGKPFKVTTRSGSIRVMARVKTSNSSGYTSNNFDFWARELELFFDQDSNQFKIIDSEHNNSEERYLFKLTR
jgi:hypothetical protein